jgi:hypothetical protein
LFLKPMTNINVKATVAHLDRRVIMASASKLRPALGVNCIQGFYSLVVRGTLQEHISPGATTHSISDMHIASVRIVGSYGGAPKHGIADFITV